MHFRTLANNSLVSKQQSNASCFSSLPDCFRSRKRVKALTVKLISAIVSEKIKPLRPHVTNPYFSPLRRIDSQFTVALSLVQLSGNVIAHACATSSFLLEALNSPFLRFSLLIYCSFCQGIADWELHPNRILGVLTKNSQRFEGRSIRILRSNI